MYAMRPLRNFKTNQCCHLIRRIANRAFFLNDEGKTRFVERLWRVATFSCVEVLAYCFMSNHFHILVYVSDPRELSDNELLACIRALYSAPCRGGKSVRCTRSQFTIRFSESSRSPRNRDVALGSPGRGGGATKHAFVHRL